MIFNEVIGESFSVGSILSASYTTHNEQGTLLLGAFEAEPAGSFKSGCPIFV
jgi:hypothetical protein